jgi:hypothetical protein
MEAARILSPEENKPLQESHSETTAITRMPSLQYLLSCSRQSLNDLELASLNRSSNCLRAARLEWQEAVAQREIAGVVRWLIENRDALLQMTARTVDVRPVEELPGLPGPDDAKGGAQ